MQRYAYFWFRKGSGNSLSITFWVWFFNKNISHVTFYWLAKFHCLIAFTSWDIGQYAYRTCLFPRLWCHKFWNLIQWFFYMKKKSKQGYKYLEKKKRFSSFLKAFQLPKIILALICTFKIGDLYKFKYKSSQMHNCKCLNVREWAEMVQRNENHQICESSMSILVHERKPK